MALPFQGAFTSEQTGNDSRDPVVVCYRYKCGNDLRRERGRRPGLGVSSDISSQNFRTTLLGKKFNFSPKKFTMTLFKSFILACRACLLVVKDIVYMYKLANLSARGAIGAVNRDIWRSQMQPHTH